VHWSVNIRKFVVRASHLDDLVGLGSLTPAAARFLDAAVRSGLNVLVSSGTQAGKTTLLNGLAATIPPQERVVTEQISRLASVAREEGDYLGEQFMQWFLKEQVEEVATINTLVKIADRAGENLFNLEDFVARELAGTGAADPTAPEAAGGNL